MGGSDEDSTGKNKIQENKTRTKVLSAAFVVGLCIGVIISERLYLWSNESTATANGPGRKLGANGAVQATGDKIQSNSNSEPVNDLEAVLRKVAPNKEVLMAVSNKNLLYEGMLQTFLEGLEQAKISNYLIAALDVETRDRLTSQGRNAYHLELIIPKSQEETGSNHAVSAMKFGIIKRFLVLGWSVFLSDVDIAVLQNPFDHLYRDSDIEGMTDGFDEATAYGAIEGFDDPSMGWARYAQSFKHFNLNSGLFYIKANERTLDLVTRLDTRLMKEKYWDQSAYNEEIFRLSHGEYKSPQVTVRVLDIYKFMNSKVLFKDVRHRPKAQQPAMPVTVHINYHPDKHERMKAVNEFYLKGKEDALEHFPGGSEPGSK